MAIVTALSMQEALFKIKHEGRARKGVSTGIASVDECLLLNKQMLMIVTGIAGRGKSEFVDMMAVNSAILHGWNWVYFSPENPVVDHLEKIVEKKMGNRLNSASQEDIEDAIKWAHDHFSWIVAPDDKFSLMDIQNEVEEMIVADGKKVDVIVYDPWNELDHSKQGSRDDQYISDCLTKVRRFHKKYDLMTCIVIHPKGLSKDKDGNYPVPTLLDCNGGVMWSNKADYGLCVHRPNMMQHGADILIQKVKSKKIGKVGKIHLDYDVISGRFKDENDTLFTLPEILPF
jgi:twinkle protein